ncbi:MAG TPA: hypothetical protein VGN82_14290 [Bosea sp. (in: a-proteobacteria)]|jgi:hypothetical protein|uniref:hypothetical protein n=1 Tax=Bosea sp. (in: a-proteobacteria) TaxID=1871050 RepID=UPI002E130416|nr:hypothetical protein [Bosea sp. (in: a-proteobacteria)]
MRGWRAYDGLMDQLNDALLAELRHLYGELRTLASDGLAALGPPGSGPDAVDLHALAAANAHLRILSLMIQAVQDAEAN